MNRQKARERAEALVAQMTVEERASQLRFDAPAIERLGIPAYNWWNEALHGLARGGTATSFPQAIGMAAMFDDALLEQIAAAISTEARAKYNAVSKEGDRDIYHGLNMWSPNINLFRDPRWGRGHETYGEDPYLTSRLGKAFVKGLQGDGETLRAAAAGELVFARVADQPVGHQIAQVLIESGHAYAAAGGQHLFGAEFSRLAQKTIDTAAGRQRIAPLSLALRHLIALPSDPFCRYCNSFFGRVNRKKESFGKFVYIS